MNAEEAGLAICQRDNGEHPAETLDEDGLCPWCARKENTDG